MYNELRAGDIIENKNSKYRVYKRCRGEKIFCTDITDVDYIIVELEECDFNREIIRVYRGGKKIWKKNIRQIELKNTDIVTLRNGIRKVYIDNAIYSMYDDSIVLYENTAMYTNFRHHNDETIDIVKVISKSEEGYRTVYEEE